MTPPESSTAPGAVGRRTPIWLLVSLAVLVSIVPAFVTVVLLGGGFETYPDVRSVLVDFVIPDVAMLVVLVLVIVARGLWGPVVRDDRPTRPWVWLVPAALTVTALAATDWRRVVDGGLTSVVGLVGVAILVANEELLYRGVLLDELRRRTTEARAGWLSSILFGLVHFLGGPVQVLVSTVFGQLMYLSRRVSGGIVVPIIAHTAWNYSVMSSFLSADPDDEAMSSVYLSLLSLALLVGVVVGRRRVEPEVAS